MCDSAPRGGEGKRINAIRVSMTLNGLFEPDRTEACIVAESRVWTDVTM